MRRKQFTFVVQRFVWEKMSVCRNDKGIPCSAISIQIVAEKKSRNALSTSMEAMERVNMQIDKSKK